ncbi:MAG: pilus assembly protein PilP [Cellvibrionaceae bacterium]|nr:pilus assembly protein PilP [Cellvibrionaceae bacterium]MCV6626726.1 pilus assembly protein PilP [Cellvibrionaceae bacterium]
MMRRSVLVVALALGACSFEGQHQDLRDYIEETKRRPLGRIEPLPEFRPYKAFSYGAIKLRSPFERIKEEQKQEFIGSSAGVEPDFAREREYLEGYSMAELKMVGTIEKDNTLWALVNDSDGGVHRVTTGNYLGKNHGRVIAAAQGQLDIVEIIPDNLGGWVERPRVLKLEEE